MKKTLLLAASALMAFFAMNVASASAHGANIYACLGAGQNDGSFETQQVGSGTLPGVGLGLSQDLCVTLNLNHVFDGGNNLLNQLANAEPPEPPTQEQLEELIDDIANINYSSPLAALILATTVCSGLDLNSYCNAVIGGALGGPIPLGSVTLEGESGNCFQGQQSGTGTTSSFAGHSQSLDWTADYGAGGNLLGVLSGSAEDRFGGANDQNLSGLIGPGCGSGAKALVMVTSG